MKGGTKMPKTALLSLKGEKIKDIKLDDSVWKITPNEIGRASCRERV